MKPTADEIMKFLRDVEHGAVTLMPTEHPRDVYCGDVHYIASNGWEIVIFNDCQSWDYIDSVTDAEGNTATFEDLCKDCPGGLCGGNEAGHPLGYDPPDDVAERIYGIT